LKKKSIAVCGSILFYIAAFLGCWELLIQGVVSNTFVIWGFPLLVGSYFLLVGTFLCRTLSLRRRSLLLWMNGVGYPLCWILLLFRLPVLLSSLVILIFLIPMTIFLALTWFFLTLALVGVRWIRTKRKN
jgi:hypothetical protein